MEEYFCVAKTFTHIILSKIGLAQSNIVHDSKTAFASFMFPIWQNISDVQLAWWLIRLKHGFLTFLGAPIQDPAALLTTSSHGNFLANVTRRAEKSGTCFGSPSPTSGILVAPGSWCCSGQSMADGTFGN